MKKISENKKITIDDLALMVAKGFDSVTTNMATKDDLKEVNKKLDDIDYRLGKIESNHERRIDLLEDRMQVVKTYFEKNPKLKVKFS
jgi:septal ring factor EnvC (AmiA/AmiB activator)